MSPTDMVDLTNHVHWLETWFDRSQWLYIILVALTVVSTFASYRLGVNLKQAQDRLAGMKDDENRQRIEQIQNQAKKDKLESDEKIAEATARTAEAKAESGRAIEGQKKLEVDAERARAETAQSRKEQEQLKKHNLELQSQVEQERIERLRLQERVSPRRLSAEQKAKLRDALGKFPPGNVKVTVFIGTDDGIPFSMDLIEAIDGAGWKAEHQGQTTMGGTIRGVALLIKDASNPPARAVMLQSALRAIGIEAAGVIDPTMGADDLILFVAPKP